MKVLFVSPAPFPSTHVFAREQPAALVRLGHEAHVVGPDGTGGPWPTPEGVQFHQVPGPAQMRHVRAVVKRTVPDLVHVYETSHAAALRGSARALAVEVATTSLHPAPLRQLALMRRYLAVRAVSARASINPRLVGPARLARFHVRMGASTWAHDVRGRRHVEPGLCIYQGTTGSIRALDRMLTQFARARSLVGEAQLLIVSRDQPAGELVDLVVQSGLGRAVDVVHNPGPEALIEMMSRAAVSLSWVPRQRGFGDQPVLKTLDAQASGVPFVATPTRANRRHARYGGGTVAASEERFGDTLARVVAGSDVEAVDGAYLESLTWDHVMRHDWLPIYERATSLHNRSWTNR